MGPGSKSKSTGTSTLLGFFFRSAYSDAMNGADVFSNEGRRYRVPPKFPTRFHPSDIIQFGSDEKVQTQIKGHQ